VSGPTDRSRTRAAGGTGLGLAIARQLVEGHGGTMKVENRAGGGALFSFFLPANGALNEIAGGPVANANATQPGR
jgi:signal transduction histidine kinase